MADGPGKPGDSSDEAKHKKVSAYVGIVGVVASVLLALYQLTGVNPVKDVLGISSSTTNSPPTKTQERTVTRELAATSVPALPSWTTKTPTRTTKTTPAWMKRTDFRVESQHWAGPCSRAAGCPMNAIFRNRGGQGAASATFYIHRQGTNKYLAYCSVVIPATPPGSVARAGCTAQSGLYQQYVDANPGSSVYMYITVNNTDLETS